MSRQILNRQLFSVHLVTLPQIGPYHIDMIMIMIMISIIIIIINIIHLVTLSPKPAQTPTPSSSNLTITASAAISHSSIFEICKISTVNMQNIYYKYAKYLLQICKRFITNMQNILHKRLQSHHYCLCHHCSFNGKVIHSSI